MSKEAVPTFLSWSALGVEEKDLPFMMSSPLSVFGLLNDNVCYESFVNPACIRFTAAVR